MILKKPYALFIKFFKPAHLLICISIAYLIYRTNRILDFFNNYIYSNNNVVGETIKDNLSSLSLYVIPIILILVSLLFLGIMFDKKKPFKFYIITIFSALIILIINIYNINFLEIMEKSLVSIKLVKLNHDLVLINIIIEAALFIMFIIRGLGLNFKKFNFDSDITKLDISDKDKEEFELDINLDLNETKRKRKRNLRYFKYVYKENKIIINVGIILSFVLILVCILFLKFKSSNMNIEGQRYYVGNFSIAVNKTILLNDDLNGISFEDKHLVVISASLQSGLKNTVLYLKDISLEVGEAVFLAKRNYSNSLLDIGTVYDEFLLTNEYTDYLFVFEIPDKYIKSDLYLTYNDKGVKTKIKLNPKILDKNLITTSMKKNETISFKETLGDISFNISSYELKKEFIINYNYCVNENDCLLSKEYIKPTIDSNYDKCILKLNVDYVNNSKLDINSFYKLFSSFGYIYYKVGEHWHTQTSDFEELVSKKASDKRNIYIGVNSNILNAESIKLIFNIRGSNYEYILK